METKKESFISRRKATNKDKELARRIHHMGYHDVVIEQFGEWDEDKQDHFFDNDWEKGGFEIINCNGALCGYMAVDDNESDITFRELVISPDYQGMGIGSSIIKEFINKAKGRNIPLRLQTFHENKALNLYHRLGFKQVEETDTHVVLEI